jgi:dCTP deaminase
MTLLADYEIAQLGKELVTPFEERNVQPASIDLRLGNEFMLPNTNEIKYIDLRDPETFEFAYKKIMVGNDSEFIIHPGQFVLSATREIVTLPDNIWGRIEGKSSLGRIGLIVHATAGFIDPGFRGPLTLEMTNIFPVPIILRPGDLICQVSFGWMKKVRYPYKGKYQDATGVDGSKYAEVNNA